MRFAHLMGVRRTQLLAELNRRVFDLPATIRTNFVAWDDTIVTFSEQRDVCSAEVVVDDDIDIVILTSRLEALLNCIRGPQPSTITYTTKIGKYGSVAKARHVLCDEIDKRTTGETLGRMKPRAHGLAAGMIAVTIRDYQDFLSFECSNSARGRLFGAWMSIVLRLDELLKSREPAPEVRSGLLILQDAASGLLLVRRETSVLGQPPVLLLYSEGSNGVGTFFNGAGAYLADDQAFWVPNVIPMVRQIVTRPPTEETES
jgi:hypothetical protein